MTTMSAYASSIRPDTQSRGRIGVTSDSAQVALNAVAEARRAARRR
jgi:hypothetical protein